MLINPVTIRTSRHVIEHAIEALQIRLTSYDVRLARKAMSSVAREDLKARRNGIEMAMLHLQDALAGYDKLKEA